MRYVTNLPCNILTAVAAATVNPYGLCVSCFLPVFGCGACFDTATPSTSAFELWQHSSSWLPWHSSSSSSNGVAVLVARLDGLAWSHMGLSMFVTL
jgi:hypothetical protein